MRLSSRADAETLAWVLHIAGVPQARPSNTTGPQRKRSLAGAHAWTAHAPWRRVSASSGAMVRASASVPPPAG
jgi:hypothetical protein